MISVCKSDPFDLFFDVFHFPPCKVAEMLSRSLQLVWEGRSIFIETFSFLFLTITFPSEEKTKNYFCNKPVCLIFFHPEDWRPPPPRVPPMSHLGAVFPFSFRDFYLCSVKVILRKRINLITEKKPPENIN